MNVKLNLNTNIISRLISLGIVSVILALLNHLDTLHKTQMGKDAFLAQQAARFNHYYSHPHSIISEVIACVTVISAFLAVYELIAFIVAKIMSGTKTGEQASQE